MEYGVWKLRITSLQSKKKERETKRAHKSSMKKQGRVSFSIYGHRQSKSALPGWAANPSSYREYHHAVWPQRSRELTIEPTDHLFVGENWQEKYRVAHTYIRGEILRDESRDKKHRLQLTYYRGQKQAKN